MCVLGLRLHVQSVWFVKSVAINKMTPVVLESEVLFCYSSRFLRGRPPSSCAGVPEGVLGRVWSQSEWCETQQPSCNTGLSTQRGGVAFDWHHSAAPKCSTHWRDCKSRPGCFLNSAKSIWNIKHFCHIFKCSIKQKRIKKKHTTQLKFSMYIYYVPSFILHH